MDASQCSTGLEGHGRLRALESEIQPQAGGRQAQASLQEWAAGSFLPVTPLVTAAPITSASKRLGPQGHKFLLSLVSISTAPAVCQERYSYFYHLQVP